MPPATAIAQQFFVDHPEERDNVLKAHYAYHTGHSRHEPLPQAHYFPGEPRTSQCVWCKRSREDVRWDNLPPQCQQRPRTAFPQIRQTLLHEEHKAHQAIDRASSVVKRVVTKRGMSGDTLAFLHHTHGCDPETVASIVDVPEPMLTEYFALMEVERERSRSAIVREIIRCND